MEQIPVPARERLLFLTRILEQSAENILSSAQIEVLTGWSSYTIRKDISCLGDENGSPIGTSLGYDKNILLPMIRKALNLDKKRKFCIVGLGRLGSAYLSLGNTGSGGLPFPSGSFGNEPDGFELAAGFDINVNRIEILPSTAPLYPAYKMGEVIGRFNIEIALLCVPAASAQASAEKLAAAGIKGIVNFAPVVLNLPPEITVRNVYVMDELRALAVKMTV